MDPVVTCAAVDDVVPRVPAQPVVAIPAVDHVGGVAAVEPVLAVAALDDVQAEAAVEAVVGWASDQVIGAEAAGHRLDVERDQVHGAVVARAAVVADAVDRDVHSLGAAA